MSQTFLIFFVVCIISFCNSEKIDPEGCGNTGLTGLCEIKEVRINPCKEAQSNKPCVLKRGKSAGIEIDLHALKTMDSFKALPYGVILGNDVPWITLSNNGCNFTQCPISQDADQLYKFDLQLQRSLPRGRFHVKFKFWNDDNEGCCTSFHLKLI